VVLLPGLATLPPLRAALAALYLQAAPAALAAILGLPGPDTDSGLEQSADWDSLLARPTLPLASKASDRLLEDSAEVVINDPYRLLVGAGKATTQSKCDQADSKESIFVEDLESEENDTAANYDSEFQRFLAASGSVLLQSTQLAGRPSLCTQTGGKGRKVKRSKMFQKRFWETISPSPKTADPPPDSPLRREAPLRRVSRPPPRSPGRLERRTGRAAAALEEACRAPGLDPATSCRVLYESVAESLPGPLLACLPPFPALRPRMEQWRAGGPSLAPPAAGTIGLEPSYSVD
jgi:hypothetical protein